jgi:ABC-2 type transport system permease protein
MMQVADQVFVLARRGVRDLVRVPAAFLPSMAVPLFFYLIYSAGIGPIAGRVTGTDFSNYHGVVLATILFLATTNGSSAAGFSVVRDIDSGYFDKLVLTRASAPVLIVGRLCADGLRTAFATSVILLVGVFTGAGLASGISGFVGIIVLTTGWAIAWSGVALAIALRTGSLDAVQLAFFVGFPIVFLSPAFGPRELLDGWMAAAASANPVTYLIEAARYLILDGWNFAAWLHALLAILIVGTITLTLAALALTRRVNARG